MNRGAVRSVTVVVGCAALVVALGALGVALAPAWPDDPYLAAPLTSEPGVPARDATTDDPVELHQVRREEITVAVAGTRLAATVYAPAAPGRYPAVAFVHGAGPGPRADFSRAAEQFAQAGIVAVAYDKRADYAYFGDRDFDELADDAAAVVRMLRARRDVDPARAGLWGLSEGGRVVPLAASRHPEVGFAVVVSGATRGPLRNTVWSVREGLLDAGSPVGLRRLAARTITAGPRFTFDRDPPPEVWPNVRQPVLAVYGTHDVLVPPAESTRAVVDGLRRGGNTAYTVVFFGGADHDIRLDGARAPGFVRTVTDWITGLPSSGATGGLVVGSPPVQRVASVPVPADTPWYAGVPALVATVLALVVGHLVLPMALRGRAAAGPGDWPARRRQLRRLARVGTGTFVGGWIYLGLAVALGYTRTGSAALFHGGWAVLRIAALGTAVCAVLAARDLWTARGRGWRPSRAQAATVAGAAGAGTLVLLTAAHWGLFAPGW